MNGVARTLGLDLKANIVGPGLEGLGIGLEAHGFHPMLFSSTVIYKIFYSRQ